MHFRKLFQEKAYPWVGGLAAFTGGLFMPYWCMKRIAHELLNPAINVAAISVGFIGALIAILIAGPANETVTGLKKSNRYDMLKGYARQAVYLGFTVSIYSALLLLFATKTWAPFARFPIALWVGIVVSTVLAAYRVIDILFALL